MAAVNSALQRARATIAREQEAGTLARVNAPASRSEEALVIRRFQEAWTRVDIDAIVALLTDDALLTMLRHHRLSEDAALFGRFGLPAVLDS